MFYAVLHIQVESVRLINFLNSCCNSHTPASACPRPPPPHLADRVRGADELVVILIHQRLHVAVEGADVMYHLLLFPHQVGQRAFPQQASQVRLRLEARPVDVLPPPCPLRRPLSLPLHPVVRLEHVVTVGAARVVLAVCTNQAEC